MSKYNSFYELLHGAESIPHTAHLVENFSGDDLDIRWTETDIQGTNTFATNDNIDGGLIGTTGSGNNDRERIDFNGIRQYEYDNATMICSIRRDTASGVPQCGFGQDGVDAIATNTTTHRANVRDVTTFKRLETCDGSVFSPTDSVIDGDLNFTSYKLEMNTSNIQMFITGTLEVTKTANLPSVRLQPFFQVSTGTTASNTCSIRYMECYNK